MLAHAQTAISVTTRNYNNQRTGANLSETVLNTSNVTAGQFGKLFELPVDDQVYAGVLYVAGLQIGGTTHNVIYVATTNNSVYAFDADTLGPPLWSRNFNDGGQPSTNAELGQACGTYTDFRGNIGIVGTPVIDPNSGTMYFVTRAVLNGNTIQMLRAISITTGLDQANSPELIQATVPGTGDGGTTVTFNPVTENQRPALALSQGVVYIAWASFCDTGPYHGWVLGYNATTLAQVAAFNATPNGSEAGIWMAGAGMAFDGAGNMYVATGNGTFDGASEYGESLVKLAPGSLGFLDYFAPSSYNTLNANDLDFGSAGPTLLPGTNLVVQGGKTGIIYLLNTANLGQEASGDLQIPEFFQAVDTTVRPGGTHHIHNASPSWNSPEGLNLYVWGENDYLHQYQFNTSSQTFTTTPAATGSILPPVGMPGGMMVLSANASQTGTGVLWASVPRNGDANQFMVPGNLYAFNAENLALLWSSTGVGQDLLNFSKGSAPVEVNGKVYVGSPSRFVSVYGLNSSGPAPQDLAFNQTATSSTPCGSSQTAAQAVDGSFSTSPWCSSVASPWLMVDLGAVYTVSRFVVEHAGAGGEDFSLNTAAYNIQVSTDGLNFTPVVDVSGSVDSITTNDIAPTTARYVKLNIVTPTQTTNTTANIYEFQVFGSLTGSSADFSLSASPGTLTTTAGFQPTSFTSTAIALNGFSSTIVLSANGLPAGTTASFNSPSLAGSGDSIVTIATTCSTPAGTYTVTITGTAGSLQHSATINLTVNPSSFLCSSYNIANGLVIDGTEFTAGLDGGGQSYSANLLGSTVSFGGSTFILGPPNALDAVSSATVTLPAGQYSTLALLATGVNGGQASQNFAVSYTDGTNATFTQSLSDWHSPQGYPGESLAATMAYRDVSNGTKDNRTFYLYGYTFALNVAKTVSSITLPANNNVMVLAMTLGGTPSPDFSMAATPSSQTVSAGGGTSYTATVGALDGFNGTVTLSASGLPAGVTVGFNPAMVSGAGTSTVTVTTTSGTTPAGSYPLTITGTSGGVQHSANVTLVVNGGSSGSAPVNLSSVYNVSNGMVADGTMFPSKGGLDQLGSAYSATLLGSAVSFGGVTFALGPANAADVVSNTTVALPAGQYSKLAMLATAVNGGQASQRFTVNYADGTNATFTQSLSDWHSPQGYPGESQAVTMAYRDLSNGTEDNRTFYLYGYTFTLNVAKTVSSITLPANNNVMVLALTLAGTASPAFSMAATPSSQTVSAGGGTSYTATVGALNGFSGTVTLSASGLPAGATVGFNPAMVSGAGTSTVTVTTTSGTTPVGSYPLTITGTSGGVQNSANVTLNVADFSMAATPSSQTVSAGGGTSYTATVGALDGFNGTVTLSASGLPAGVTVGFNPAMVSGAGTSTVTVTTTSGTTPAGSYPLTITGTSGGVQHSANVTLVVNGGSSGSAPVNLSSVYNVSNGMVADGTMFPSKGGLDQLGSAYSATLLGPAVSFGGVTFALGPANAADVVSNTTVPLPAGQYSKLAMLATAVNGGQASQRFTVNYADGTNATFTQSLSDWHSPQGYPGESQAVTMAYRDLSNGTEDNRTFYLYGYTFTLNVAKTVSSITLPANNNVMVLALTLAGTASPAFSMAATPSSQTVSAGGGTSYTATVGALNGFSGTVTLSASGLPAGATVGFNPAMVSGAGTSTVTVTTTSGTTPVGSYPLTITGTSGGVQNSANVTLNVADFSMAATPSSQTVSAGGGTSYTATVGALDGFNGTVTLSASGLPAGVTVGFNPAMVSGAGTSTVTVTTTSGTTPTGSYPLTITGTSGGVQHSANVTLNVGNFTMAATPSSQTVTAGSGTSYTATVGAVNGFSGTVTLSASGLPAGATVGFNPAMVSGAGTSTVTFTTTSGMTPVGIYPLTITGTSGGVQNSANVTLNVADFSMAATPSSQTVSAGGGTSYTATVGALDGFNGTVTLSASGLPAGATVGFNPAMVSGAGTSTVTVTTTSGTTPAGSYPLTITGTSGGVQHSANVTLVVNGGSSGSAPVNLSSVYNVSNGMVADGTMFPSKGGLDQLGSAYSATLLGSAVGFGGVTFALGPANAADVVSNTTVPLPAGQYSKLAMLATAVNGGQASQRFTVNYADGTNATFTQSLSDWYSPQGYPGESQAVTMAYRDLSNGTEDNRTFYLYGYTFTLNVAKTVSSITLPANSNVMVLAFTLNP